MFISCQVFFSSGACFDSGGLGFGLQRAVAVPIHRVIFKRVPTIPSLEKICIAFGITLSQLFAEEDAPVSLTEAQKKLLERWSRLSKEQQAVVFALIDKM